MFYNDGDVYGDDVDGGGSGVAAVAVTDECEHDDDDDVNDDDNNNDNYDSDTDDDDDNNNDVSECRMCIQALGQSTRRFSLLIKLSYIQAIISALNV